MTSPLFYLFLLDYLFFVHLENCGSIILAALDGTYPPPIPSPYFCEDLLFPKVCSAVVVTLRITLVVLDKHAKYVTINVSL